MASRLRRLSSTSRPRLPRTTLLPSQAHASTCPPSLLDLISSSISPTNPHQYQHNLEQHIANDPSYSRRYRSSDAVVSASFGPGGIPKNQRGQGQGQQKAGLKEQKWSSLMAMGPVGDTGGGLAAGLDSQPRHFGPPPPPMPMPTGQRRPSGVGLPSAAPKTSSAFGLGASAPTTASLAGSPLPGAGATPVPSSPASSPSTSSTTSHPAHSAPASHPFSTTSTSPIQAASDSPPTAPPPAPASAQSPDEAALAARRAAAREQRYRMEELWGASNGEAANANATNGANVTGPGSSFGDRPKPRLRLRPTFDSGPEALAGALSFIPQSRKRNGTGNGNGQPESKVDLGSSTTPFRNETRPSPDSPLTAPALIKATASKPATPPPVPRFTSVPFPYPPSSLAASTNLLGTGGASDLHLKKPGKSVVDEAVQAKPLTMQEQKERADMTKVAILFPGSGCQYVGMGGWLLDKYPEAREVWEEAEDALADFDSWRHGLGIEDALSRQLGIHIDLERSLAAPSQPTTSSSLRTLREVVFGGPQPALTLSTNAQPAILITSLCLARVLGSAAIARSDVLAGHSSGEYTAAVVAGALTVREAVRLTRLHGLLTSRTLRLKGLKSFVAVDADPEERAQMSAVLIKPGKGYAEVDEVVERIRNETRAIVEVASYNSSSQIVLSGTRAGILAASEALAEADIGARAADLPCAAPFHSTLMAPAAAGMRVALSHIPLRPLSRPLISGLTALPLVHPPDLSTHLIDLIAAPVRWSAAIETMVGMGVRKAVFVGPGRALANLAKRQAQAVGRPVRFAGEGQGHGKGQEQANGNRVGGRREPGGQEENGKEEVEMGSVATEEDFERVREMLQD